MFLPVTEDYEKKTPGRGAKSVIGLESSFREKRSSEKLIPGIPKPNCQRGVINWVVKGKIVCMTTKKSRTIERVSGVHWGQVFYQNKQRKGHSSTVQ